MLAGDVVRVDFGISAALPTEVVITASGLEADSAAQCHLCTAVGVERLVGGDYGNVGPVGLAQVRSVLADLLDIG